MQEKSDAELLREYADQTNEAAFREIVTRHADLVYASALRQVRSPELARDIAQSVFADLVRKAPSLGQTLAENASLVGWLYRSTRFAAHKQLRNDRRRKVRERQAMENFNSTSETATEWEEIGPVLDEAMADLSDEDREALLLRYFKNHDFRTIGVALGVSDDAAQKRVSRALERLRAEFHRRGVTTTGVALAAAVSANAVTVGPAGLAAALSTAALSGTALTTTATATQAIAMTTMQKTLITATIVAAVGVGIYEARQASTLRAKVQTLEQQQAGQIQQLQRERDEAMAKQAQLQDESARLNRNNSELIRLRGEVTRLRTEMAGAKLSSKRSAATEDLQSSVEQAVTNASPFVTLSATIRAVVPWNQALVTGGWKVTSGRAMVFISPRRGDDATQLKIETHIAELPEDLAQKLGLDQFYTDSQETTSAGVLTTQQYEAILKAAEVTAGVDILNAPSITTISGRQASVQLGNNKETSSGEKYTVGPALSVMPTISADGQSVDLGVVAKFIAE